MTGDMEPARPELPEGNTLQPLKDQIAALRKAFPADDASAIARVDERIARQDQDHGWPDLSGPQRRRIGLSFPIFIAVMVLSAVAGMMIGRVMARFLMAVSQ